MNLYRVGQHRFRSRQTAYAAAREASRATPKDDTVSVYLAPLGGAPEVEVAAYIKGDRVFRRPRTARTKTRYAIVSTRGICGGRACFIGTRLPIWTLAALWRSGASDADILAAMPTLTARQLSEAREYIREHPTEIEQDIRDNQRQATQWKPSR